MSVASSDSCFLGGDAMQKTRSLSLASSVRLSVDHAGERTTSILAFGNPFVCIASMTSRFICSMAGHPAKVGVIFTTTQSPSTFTSRMTFRSTSERTGISGSITCSKASQISCRVVVSLFILESVHKINHICEGLFNRLDGDDTTPMVRTVDRRSIAWPEQSYLLQLVRPDGGERFHCPVSRAVQIDNRYVLLCVQY